MQPPKVRKVISMLESEGWRLHRTVGDHRQFVKGGRAVTVSGRMGDHLPKGTWGAIKRTVGW